MRRKGWRPVDASGAMLDELLRRLPPDLEARVKLGGKCEVKMVVLVRNLVHKANLLELYFRATEDDEWRFVRRYKRSRIPTMLLKATKDLGWKYHSKTKIVGAGDEEALLP